MRKLLCLIGVLLLLSLVFGCARQQVLEKVQEQEPVVEEKEEPTGDGVTQEEIDKLLEDIDKLETEDPGGLSE
jgi:hypothetical protein